MNKKNTITFAIVLLAFLAEAQYYKPPSSDFTRADSLRGSITPGRSWWDVMRYDLAVRPVYEAKSTTGSSEITYKVIEAVHSDTLQIDLQEPLVIDSAILDDKQRLSFSKDGNAWYINTSSQAMDSRHKLKIYFSGKPHEAVRPPWEGGWTFTKDSLGRPWMTVTCQGTGASIWYPCKDHQSDEPDEGASLTMIVPQDLVGVANGRLQSKTVNKDGTVSYKWAVVNPISTYCLIPYIGKYVNFSQVYNGEKGNLDLNYWLLDYHLEKGKSYMPEWVHKMMKCFEYWFGSYPFYEDGYKLVETSNYGMEHQSAVSYGNFFKHGYHGTDGSGTGWGMKWDFIIVHESGHEWFGNNITSDDLADMWIHEGFTNYSETLFTAYYFGEDAGNEYNAGTRKGIRNQRAIIPPGYGVNAQGSGDMYPKAGNMIHTIRHSINNDKVFRQILRGLNKTFYHKTVTTDEVEEYIDVQSGYNFDNVFNQYLRTTQIPVFEYYFSPDSTKVYFRYTNCIKGFDLPLSLTDKNTTLKIFPSEEWKELKIKDTQRTLFSADAIEKMYYLKPAAVPRPE